LIKWVRDETLHGSSLENELILKDFGHIVGIAIAPCDSDP
jgi:hypothetical protein